MIPGSNSAAVPRGSSGQATAALPQAPAVEQEPAARALALLIVSGCRLRAAAFIATNTDPRAIQTTTGASPVVICVSSASQEARVINRTRQPRLLGVRPETHKRGAPHEGHPPKLTAACACTEQV